MADECDHIDNAATRTFAPRGGLPDKEVLLHFS